MATAPRHAAPKPAAPLPNPAEGFSLVRPFQRAWQFTSGTIMGGLSGMSRWGARGIQAGGIVGALYGIANVGAVSFIGATMGGLLVGAAIGIAFGTAIGALTGGFTRAGRGQQRDDAMGRARRPRQQYTSVEAATDRVDNLNQERLLQQNQELAYDQKTYWTDHVNESRGGGFGRGF